MGGDTTSVRASSVADEDLSTMKQRFPDRFRKTPVSSGLSGSQSINRSINGRKGLTCSREISKAKTAEEKEHVSKKSDARSIRDSYNTLEFEANERRIHNVYAQVLENYDEMKKRIVNKEVAKSEILSYTPGSWVENVGGKTINDYKVPKTTTILLIGPKGSGKSSLINRISRVLEDDKFAPESGQVTYNSLIRDRTFFHQEYMIPRGSTSFCLHDSGGFSYDLSKSLEMIKCWMMIGICCGEFPKSVLDSSSLQDRMKSKAHQDKFLPYERRTVNFVIFVVNGLSVLKCVESNGADKLYMQMVAEVFNSPFLSFKDHKPAIAITHGDRLSLSERARVRVYLGKLLGVHPTKQTFDIPDNSEPTTELTIADMVRYVLEHADRNLPCKGRPMISLGSIIELLWTCLLVLFFVAFIIIVYGFGSLKYVLKMFLNGARKLVGR